MTSLYYGDHLTDSDKDMWSNLRLLADAAVMVQEEEQRLRLLAEKGEDSEKSFFYLYPRKARSRRYTQQNPNGVSTSSLSLTSYMTQNPSFDDAELHAKKGKSKIVSEDDGDHDKESDDEKKLFEKNVRKFVRGLRRNFDNLDGCSTSSSFLNLRCYEPSLLLDYNNNTDKSEKTEMKDTTNPNYQSSSPSSCLTENTISRKRRALQERKSNGKFKKAKVASFPRRDTEEETPQWIFEVMRTLKADVETPRLIFERELSASDVKSGQSRLLMPFQQLIRNDFLTPAECRAMEKDEHNDNDENIGVGTILVNQRFEKWGLRFKIWAMEKESGHGTLNYALNWGWNDVVKGNGLKAGDKISLWTFRWRGVLCFALETY